MPFQNPTNLTLIDANNLGIIVSGGSGFAGWSVVLGDVNGDSKADILLGAPASNQAYLVYGSSTPNAVDLSTMPITTGVLLSGGSGFAGSSVAIGDVNGDGKADMLIGANTGSQAYLVLGSSSLSTVNLGTMPATTGVLLSGSSNAGLSVAVGDVNGDGKADMLVGAATNKAYLVFGSSNPSSVNLDTMPATTGILLSGGSGGVGFSVAIGDVNGDGKADILLGAPANNQAYLVFGSSSPSAVNLGTMPATTGILLSGGSGNAGFSVAVGDVNGDGKADMLMGAYGNNQAYLVFGSSSPSSVNLSTMSAVTGIVMSGGSGGAGFSVAVGDANGDGKADMLLGANIGYPVYLVYGSSNPVPINLSTMPATAGVLLSGGSDLSGIAVAIGDVNGDGKADMLMGAEGSNKAYLVYGGPQPMPVTTCSSLALAGLGTGTLTYTGTQYIGSGTEWAGLQVAIGDVNGDDKADMLIGAPAANSNNGAAYLVLGSANPVSSALSTNIVFSGSGAEQAGLSIAIGDVNGDGKADMLIGAPAANSGNGAAYLVLGSTNPLNSVLSSAVKLSGSGLELAGWSVAIGDVNGDGKGDMLIGAYSANGNNGAAYLVLGSTNPVSSVLSSAIVFTGSGAEQAGISVTIGDVNGDGKGDMLIGAFSANSNNGAAYLVLGSTNPVSSALSSTIVFSGSGAELAGIYAAIGDVNGDGKADMLIGAPAANSANGAAYLVLGSASPVSDLLSNAIFYSGSGAERAGLNIAIGDITGDGYADMVIGAEVANSNDGKVYLIFGSNSPASSILSSAIAFSGTGGEVVGDSVAVGDVNGDGKGDILTGARFANGNNGKAYLILGNETPWLTSPANSTNYVPWLLGPANTTYVVGNPAFAIDPNIALDDVSTQIVSASVQLSNYQMGEDILAVGTLPGGISWTFDSSIGKLILNGTSSVQNYQTALKGITYQNVNLVSPSLVNRTVTYQVDDGMLCGLGNKFDFNIFLQPPTPSISISPTPSSSISNTPSSSLTLSSSLSHSISGSLTASTSFTPSVTLSSTVSKSASLTASNSGSSTPAKTKDKTIAPTVEPKGNPAANLRFDSNLSRNNIAQSILSSKRCEDLEGFAVSGTGDFNNDGIKDYVIGAPGGEPKGRNKAGYATIVYGNKDVAKGQIERKDVKEIQGSLGFRVLGAEAGDQAGYAVSGAGDVNGDGYADVLIAAPYATRHKRKEAGLVTVLWGTENGYKQDIDLKDLTPEQGFTLIGATAADHAGLSVSGAGDVNGDGLADILIGAPDASIGGEAYLIYGRKEAFPFEVDLNEVKSKHGVTLVGAKAEGRFGYAVNGVRDINKDGYDDLLIGAPEVNSAYLVYGNNTLPSTLMMRTLTQDSGCHFLGESKNDRFGASVSRGGDANNDNVPDIIIGAPDASPEGRTEAGNAYVIYGRNDLPEKLSMEQLSEKEGVILRGDEPCSHTGQSVSVMTHQGKSDILIGAPDASPEGKLNAGQAYIVRGEDSNFNTKCHPQPGEALPKVIELGHLSAEEGYVLEGTQAGNHAGFAVTGPGDLDDNNTPDFVVTAVADCTKTKPSECQKRQHEPQRSDASRLNPGVDIVPNLMLGMVLAKLAIKAYEGLSTRLGQWFNGANDSKQNTEAKPLFTSSELQNHSNPALHCRWQALHQQAQALMQQAKLDKWLRYHLEDLLDEMTHDKHNLNYSLLDEWEEELASIQLEAKTEPVLTEPTYHPKPFFNTKLSEFHQQAALIEHSSSAVSIEAITLPSKPCQSLSH